MDTPLSRWRQQIEAVTGIEGEKLARLSHEFLTSEHAECAITHGWTEMELFGLHHGDLAIAARRADTQGLIPALTIGATHTYAIVAIEENRAVLRTDGGATLIHRRRLPEDRFSIPFWEHRALRAEAA